MLDSAAPPEDPHAAVAIAHAEWRLKTLQDLTEMGMSLARDLTTESAEPPTRDPVEAFARLSRAIRLTLRLHARTDADLTALRAGVPLAMQADRKAMPSARSRPRSSADHREAVRREVEAAYDIEIGDHERRDAFCAALDALLRYHEDFIDLDPISLDQAVRCICRELGLTPDWSLWTGEAWLPRREPILAECEGDAPAFRPSG